MAIEKYRVHEVAKDFGVPTKTIMEILTKYASQPKNHMQVLTDRELSIIFDCLTQRHPVSDIQVIFKDTYQEAPKAPEAPVQEPVQQKPAQPAGQQQPRRQGGQPAKQPQQPPKQQGGQTPQQGGPNAQGGQSGQCGLKPASRVPPKKIVDNR